MLKNQDSDSENRSTLGTDATHDHLRRSKEIQPQVFQFFGANNFYFGRSDLIIGTEWLHRVLGPCLAPQSDTFNISRFSGGEFMKIQDVERRKLPFF